MRLLCFNFRKSKSALLFVAFSCFYLLSVAQNSKVITGKVQDESGVPVAGVSIAIKGRTDARVAGADGSFSISAAKGDVLVFSAISFATKEVVVGDGAVINVTLSNDASKLGDVVVVGYGKQNRKNLTSAVSTVSGSELNKGAISDVGQMLQGKVPGLNISRSGDPNRAAAIILRGASTLREGAQSPLFVIDGVPGADISIIAPDDIASIDVLKDAAATSIYGNRAANGVIMVTTKRGQKGQVQVNYNGYVSLEKVSNQFDMMSADQLRKYLADNGQSLTPANDLGVSTNWQDEVQRKSAVTHNHNISFGGGTDKTIYNASINYFDQEGIIKTSGLNRAIARLSIEQKALNDKLKLGLSLTNSISDADYVPYRNTVLSQMLTYLPTSPVKNTDGTWFENPIQSSYYNPVAIMQNATENLKYKNLLGTVTAQLKLPWGLTYDVMASYQNYQTVYGAYYNKYFTSHFRNIRNTPDPPNNPAIISLTGQDGIAVRNAYQNTNKLLETYVTWDRKFGDHSINAVLGYSWQESINGDGFQTSSTNFPVDEVSYYNLGLGNPYAVSSFRTDYGGDGYQQVRLISDFARVTYNYKNKYMLQGSIRRDGSSVFGENEQWGYFPSIGAAWRIDQESFMDNQSIFSDLKLRASYGVAGNSQGFSPLTTKLIYGSVGTFYYNGIYESSLGATQNENPDLRWEKTATTNIGLDFAILKGKVRGSIEWYNKRTTDLIYTYPVNTSLYPNGSLTANVGEMSNKGFEFSLNATPVDTKDFNWTTGFNLAHNANKIVSLSDNRFKTDSILIVQPDGGGQTGATLQIIQQGQPIGQFFTFQYAGKNANGVSQYLNSKGDVVTDGMLNKTDYHAAGSAQPKLLLGWSNSFRYKDFDLNIFVRSVLGNKIFNVTRADLFRPSTAQFNNIPVEVAGESTNDYNSYRYSTRFIESGSYVRLDNATLGYNMKHIGKDIKSIRVYASVNNLFVITSYKGIDPEINQGGIAPGVDTNNFYPKTRTFLFGVNVSF